MHTEPESSTSCGTCVTHCCSRHSWAALESERPSSAEQTSAKRATTERHTAKMMRDLRGVASDATKAKEKAHRTASRAVTRRSAELTDGQPPGNAYWKTGSRETVVACSMSKGRVPSGVKKGRRAGSEGPTIATHQHVHVSRKVAAVCGG